MQHPSARLPEDDTWTSRWQKSSWKAKDGQAGEFTLSAGKWWVPTLGAPWPACFLCAHMHACRLLPCTTGCATSGEN
jgi:hypothetical protein